MKANNPGKATAQTEPTLLEIVQNDELSDNELADIDGGTAASSQKGKTAPVDTSKHEPVIGIIAILIGL